MSDTPLTLSQDGRRARRDAEWARGAIRLSRERTPFAHYTRALEIVDTRTRLATLARVHEIAPREDAIREHISEWIIRAEHELCVCVSSDCACLATLLIEARDAGCFT
jgi:hypothetical protein